MSIALGPGLGELIVPDDCILKQKSDLSKSSSSQSISPVLNTMTSNDISKVMMASLKSGSANKRKRIRW